MRTLPDVASTRTGEARVLTVPNVISLVRLACVPMFLWLLFGRDNRVGAALLLAGLGATDWIDGYIARRFDQVTTLGKVLDPLADRLLLGVAVVAILADGAVPLVLFVPIVAREVLVSVAVMVLAAMGARRIDVTWAGKAGTFSLMVAFPLFLLGNAPDFGGADVAEALAWIAALIGLGFGWWAAATYVPVARQALRDGRGRGQAAPGK